MTAHSVRRASVLPYAKIALRELGRLPSFILPTLLFPSVLFLFFGRQSHATPDKAWAALVSFAAFAVLGVLLFQFGVGLASDRDSPWERYVRTLGAPVWKRFSSRIAAALVFSLASLIPLVVAAAITSPIHPSPRQAISALAAVLFGSIPFGLLGIAIGYWVPPRGALPVTNLVYLPLAYAGGLFGEHGGPPARMTHVTRWIPTRIWNDLVLSAAFGGPVLSQAARLVGWAAVFAVVAGLGYRRDEGRHYR